MSATPVVSFDDKTIICRRPHLAVEKITWDELREIEILTTDTGPILEDVFWVLHGDDKGCVIPQVADGFSELMERLQKLPGFKNQVVIDAMASATNARFCVWQKAGKPRRNANGHE